ncbi:MAG: ABC-type transporter permease, partial [Pseudomonadota bacterium]
MKRFLALLGARNKEFVRDRGSVAWSLLFPLLIVIGFSFAFSG